MNLAERECVPCRGGIAALEQAAVDELLPQLEQGWEVVDLHHLRKDYSFPDFAGGLAFVNRVGAVADAQDHHPEVFLAWGKVRLEIRTHDIDALTENDFVLAAKCDRLFGESSG